MKQVLPMISVVMGQSVLAADMKPLTGNPIVKKVIRSELKKPEGKLTKAEVEKISEQELKFNQISEVSALRHVSSLPPS